MGRGYLKRRRRDRALADRGPCFAEGCEKNGSRTHRCVTCEKRGRDFSRQCCPEHNEQGLGEVRRHALVKHPANLLRVVAAGLAGEDIS